MFRFSFCALSTSLRSTSTPFAAVALEMTRLKIEHANILEDDPQGRTDTARKLQREFAGAVERMRPLFSVATSMEVSRFYSHQMFAAMRHFGYTEDPMTRQLAVQIGKLSLRRQHEATVATLPAASAESGLNRHNQTSSPTTPNQNEIPAPREDFPPVSGPQLKVQDKYRGHWILRDPEIAITRKDRHIDPW